MHLSNLESVRFKIMLGRHDKIPESHKKMIEWAHRDSTQETKSWSNFAEWLRRDDGIFWIAAKAGSGKSTPMKYLYDNSKTRKELLVWSQDSPCEVLFSY
jgi:Tfp pilus assembly pilus retraction ATPase PilT